MAQPIEEDNIIAEVLFIINCDIKSNTFLRTLVRRLGRLIGRGCTVGTLAREYNYTGEIKMLCFL